MGVRWTFLILPVSAHAWNLSSRRDLSISASGHALAFVDTPHRLLSLFCAEDIMSITTLLIILLVVLLLGGGGFYARRRR